MNPVEKGNISWRRYHAHNVEIWVILGNYFRPSPSSYRRPPFWMRCTLLSNLFCHRPHPSNSKAPNWTTPSLSNEITIVWWSGKVEHRWRSSEFSKMTQLLPIRFQEHLQVGVFRYDFCVLTVYHHISMNDRSVSDSARVTSSSRMGSLIIVERIRRLVDAFCPDITCKIL